tara:strand:- start:9 stop:668 length:660 start_codon:yes stop_codon:yes gene_type:complete
MTLKTHPFEISGLGAAPFRFKFAVSLPSPALLEANPLAHNAALAALPTHIGLGTCHHCGRAITNCCIIESADGKESSVGSDCVAKTGVAALTDPAAKAVAKIVRDKRRAAAERRRVARRAAWFEANKDRLAAEQAERDAEAVAAKIAADALVATWEQVLEVLDRTNGYFAASFARDIRNGNAPTGRGFAIALEIFAKTFGKKNSAAYNAALTDITSSLA